MHAYLWYYCRLQTQHEMLVNAFGGELVLAPIDFDDPALQFILDIGTGAGNIPIFDRDPGNNGRLLSILDHGTVQSDSSVRVAAWH